MKVRTGIEVSSQSDIGCLRQNNEDSVGYWESDDDDLFLRKGRLAVVADGMGGYEGGQEASRLAVETLMAVYRDFAGDDPQAALNVALQTAHEEIRQYSFAHPELRGMGTTCTAAAIDQHGGKSGAIVTRQTALASSRKMERSLAETRHVGIDAVPEQYGHTLKVTVVLRRV